ncbi:MAG: AraC family transcriptional regulator, partial [Bacteroidota bacterium]
TAKSLIIRILQSKARKSFLHEFGKANSRMNFVSRYIKDHIHTRLSVQELAHVAEMSRSKFFHSFKASFGIAPNEYIVQRKMEEAKRMLRRDPRMSITEISFALGYSDSAYFTRQFKQQTGYSPSAYQKLHS